MFVTLSNYYNYEIWESVDDNYANYDYLTTSEKLVFVESSLAKNMQLYKAREEKGVQ